MHGRDWAPGAVVGQCLGTAIRTGTSFGAQYEGGVTRLVPIQLRNLIDRNIICFFRNSHIGTGSEDIPTTVPPIPTPPACSRPLR